jgi:hypothetical protein
MPAKIKGSSRAIEIKDCRNHDRDRGGGKMIDSVCSYARQSVVHRLPTVATVKC